MERTITASPGFGGEVHHERAVDLDLVDRQPLEVDERRVAGAEVVDREPLAHRVQEIQHDRRVGVDQRALGELQDEHPGGDAPGLGQLARRRSEGRCRCVRLRAEMLTAIVRSRPASRHRRCCGARRRAPTRQRLDQLAALRLGHELRRHQQPLGRVLPAHERLDADGLPRREIDLGLVVQDQLAARDAVAQLAQERQPAHGLILGLGGEDGEAARRSAWPRASPDPPGATGRRCRGRAAGRTRCRRSPARRRGRPPIRNGCSNASRTFQAIAAAASTSVSPDGRMRELVVAQARHRVRLAQRAAQPLGDRPQEGVALLATERLVDLPKPVQVDDQHAARLVGAVRRTRSPAPGGRRTGSGSAAR